MPGEVTIRGIPVVFLPPWDDCEAWKNRVVLLPVPKDSEVEPDGTICADER